MPSVVDTSLSVINPSTTSTLRQKYFTFSALRPFPPQELYLFAPARLTPSIRNKK